MTPAEAVRRFLDALQVPPERIPVGLEAQAALFRSQLAGKRMLVLLDNAHNNDLHAATELTRLAGAGASVIVSVMATPEWEWARSRLARLFASKGREEKMVGARLAGFAAELATSSERDVQNRLCGLLGAWLSDDPDLKSEFDVVVLEIRERLDPKSSTELPGHNVPGDSQEARIAWAALTAQEAARKLETLDRSSAVMELTGMDPAAAARRLAHVDKAGAADLLSHMDEELAAGLLTRMSARHPAELLALMEPPQVTAVLENMDSDWVVARFSEMASDRALVLFSALGAERVDDLLAAMQLQQAVRLLGSVGKVLEDQARLRTTVDMAEQEAKQIVAQARAEAEEILRKAQRKPNEPKDDHRE